MAVLPHCQFLESFERQPDLYSLEYCDWAVKKSPVFHLGDLSSCHSCLEQNEWKKELKLTLNGNAAPVKGKFIFAYKYITTIRKMVILLFVQTIIISLSIRQGMQGWF